MSLIAGVLELMQKLDPETVSLFVRFVEKAKSTGDLNGFVKRSLRRILEEPEVVDTVGQSER